MKPKNREKNSFPQKIEKAVAIAAALLVWQIAAMLLDQKILLASPVDVLKTLGSLVLTPDFWRTIWFSFSRIGLGFLIGFVVGCVCAALSARFHFVEVLLWPYMAAVKATPVASIIILCLVWLSSRNLSIFICFLIVLPVVYTNILTGIRHLDPKLKEMASLYEIPFSKRFLSVELPQLKPYLLAALELSIGMAWKAGVAAEVIGVPAGSIGKMLYNAKIYLATPELFAWTFTVVILSILFEKLIVGLVKGFFQRLEHWLWIFG